MAFVLETFVCTPLSGPHPGGPGPARILPQELAERFETWCAPEKHAETSYQLGKLLSRRRIDSIPVVVVDLGLNLWEVRVCLDKCVATDAIVSCLLQNTGVVLGNW
jgi:hypothetical protein